MIVTVDTGSASSTGNEIDLGSTSTLSVNVDDNTIEVNTTDSLQVKDLSITNSKIANSTIDLTTKGAGTLPIGNFATKDEDNMGGINAASTHVPTQRFS